MTYLDRSETWYWREAYSVVLFSWHSAFSILLQLLTMLLQHYRLEPLWSYFSYGLLWHHLYWFWVVLRGRIARLSFKHRVAPQNILGRSHLCLGTEKLFLRWLWRDSCHSVPSTSSCTTYLLVFGDTGFTPYTASSLLSSLFSWSWLHLSLWRWHISSLPLKTMNGGGGMFCFYLFGVCIYHFYYVLTPCLLQMDCVMLWVGQADKKYMASTLLSDKKLSCKEQISFCEPSCCLRIFFRFCMSHCARQ